MANRAQTRDELNRELRLLDYEGQRRALEDLIIPLKERVADGAYDPLRALVRLVKKTVGGGRRR